MTNENLDGLDDLSNLPHLSDTIDYATDIAPYPIIRIDAGVGSGKNYFIDMLARGHTDPDENGQIHRFPKQTVLLITSRRAKVNEIHNDKSIRKDYWIGQWDNGALAAYDDIDDFEDALDHMRKIDCSINPLLSDNETIYQRYLPCTNAAIEAYLRKHYMHNDPTTHLWNRFDMIVFDEAHAIRSDTNYQTAPYFTLRLLQETYQAQKKGLTNCKIILMTGTPRILHDFQMPRTCHLIDRMASCRNVTPKNIIFVSKKQSRSLAEKMLSDGQRAVFFFNRTRELFTFHNAIKTKYPSLASKIAVSFSDDTKRNALKKSSKDIFDRMEATEGFIAAHQQLPDGIQLFLTTERNKEGININNSDVRTMFLESHVECSVVQMAGRLRKGMDTLYIVTDSIPHEDYESKFEWLTTKDGTIINYYNQKLLELFKKVDYDPSEPFTRAPQQIDQIASYISFVEKKHPFILFDPFALRFRLYRERRRSKQYYADQNAKFDEAKSDPHKLCELVRSWYPNANIAVTCSIETQITQYIERHHFLEEEISYSQQQELLAFINGLTGESRKTLRPALKPFGYIFIPKSKHKGCSGTIHLETE